MTARGSWRAPRPMYARWPVRVSCRNRIYWAQDEQILDRLLALVAEGGRAALAEARWLSKQGGARPVAGVSPMTARAQKAETAWLLIERWSDGSKHWEGIAVTNKDASAWVHGDLEEGHAKSSLPLKVIRAAPVRSPEEA